MGCPGPLSCRLMRGRTGRAGREGEAAARWGEAAGRGGGARRARGGQTDAKRWEGRREKQENMQCHAMRRARGSRRQRKTCMRRGGEGELRCGEPKCVDEGRERGRERYKIGVRAVRAATDNQLVKKAHLNHRRHDAPAWGRSKGADGRRCLTPGRARECSARTEGVRYWPDVSKAEHFWTGWWPAASRLTPAAASRHP